MPELASTPADLSVSEAPPLRGAGFASVAMAVPDNVVPNAVINERLGLKDDWIETRTGVIERRIVEPDETLVGLGAEAGRRALTGAGADATDLDFVIVGTMTQEDIGPNVAPLVAEELGTNAPAFDVGAACCAWLDGVAVATALIETGRADSILVVGADVLSRITDQGDKSTAGLLADGAGAALMTATPGPSRIGRFTGGSDGANGHLIKGEPGTHLIHMKGRDVFKHAVNRMSEATVAALDLAGLSYDDIDLFVYHQANSRIIRAVGERLELPTERVVDYVRHFGNTSAATLPMALTQAEQEGRLAAGDTVLLTAFAAGLTWVATVVEWGVEGA
ncbi:MAG: 3-oxoacyl-ACP synthase III family protein [Solirubrobacterales bacterium]